MGQAPVVELKACNCLYTPEHHTTPLAMSPSPEQDPEPDLALEAVAPHIASLLDDNTAAQASHMIQEHVAVGLTIPQNRHGEGPFDSTRGALRISMRVCRSVFVGGKA